MDSYTVAELLRKPRLAGRVNEGRVAVVFESREVTFDELDERSDRLAGALHAQGFAKGDRVGVLLHNRVEWVELFFAVAKLGGVVVPLNYLLKAGELRYILDDCAASWVVYEQALEPVVKELRAGGSAARYVGVGTVDGDFAYEELISRAGPPPEVEVGSGDLFLLQYTSGTTGAPKGAMHTHATVLWNSFHQVVDYGITADEVYLVVPALCWAAGFHDLALATLWRGGRVVLSPSTGFTPERFLAMVERHRVTSVLLVPTVLKRVLGHPGLGDHDVSSLRLICSGGEPVPLTALADARRLLPSCAVLQVYGMSEFPTMMTYVRPDEAVGKAGSAGRACSAAEVRVVDERGQDTAPGEVGEIICRSPATMIGYYGKPDATAATLEGGWLHTGDLAHVDEDGYLYISGRSKDMIITGGLNVYPAEMERVVAQHPAVLEAAVVGVPDPEWGEFGAAMVVLRPGCELGEEELTRYLKSELATYKIPRRFTFTGTSLPRTTSGKVQKFRVRNLLGLR
ncbi:class I adenylate-forming enzyme family protein [Amycolatopsis tucumanensis]|uniref:Long-chain fatty acid--CoA ligase n=1 Tax=Amycolatopsis tucumanensis TaxID=401106 RepID=A0ABP7IW15_9PSEU|nr:AMP-binding protein [Amycolatopsis tucumanensis]MCF6424194.1 AMP-binding protein [Amycolatopsis tucumanensis]